MPNYYSGDPVMIDHTPSAAVSAGDVVISGDLPLIAHLDIAASALGALAAGGGVYTGIADGAIAIHKRVYWDDTNNKITLTAKGNRAIGYSVSAASGDGSTIYFYHLPERPSLILSSVAASSAVSNTTTETSFGVTAVIPANTLAVGDVIRVRAQGIATSTNSTDTLNAKLKIGSTVVAATGAVDATNNDIFFLEADLVVRTVGASGTIVAAGAQALGAEGTVTLKPCKLASTAIDTTATQTLDVTATWSAASASDSVRLDVFDVEILRK